MDSESLMNELVFERIYKQEFKESPRKKIKALQNKADEIALKYNKKYIGMDVIYYSKNKFNVKNTNRLNKDSKSNKDTNISKASKPSYNFNINNIDINDVNVRDKKIKNSSLENLNISLSNISKNDNNNNYDSIITNRLEDFNLTNTKFSQIPNKYSLLSNKNLLPNSNSKKIKLISINKNTLTISQNTYNKTKSGNFSLSNNNNGRNYVIKSIKNKKTNANANANDYKANAINKDLENSQIKKLKISSINNPKFLSSNVSNNKNDVENMYNEYSKIKEILIAEDFVKELMSKFDKAKVIARDSLNIRNEVADNYRSNKNHQKQLNHLYSKYSSLSHNTNDFIIDTDNSNFKLDDIIRKNNKKEDYSENSKVNNSSNLDKNDNMQFIEYDKHVKKASLSNQLLQSMIKKEEFATNKENYKLEKLNYNSESTNYNTFVNNKFGLSDNNAPCSLIPISMPVIRKDNVINKKKNQNNDDVFTFLNRKKISINFPSFVDNKLYHEIKKQMIYKKLDTYKPKQLYSRYSNSVSNIKHIKRVNKGITDYENNILSKNKIKDNIRNIGDRHLDIM